MILHNWLKIDLEDEQSDTEIEWMNIGDAPEIEKDIIDGDEAKLLLRNRLDYLYSNVII
jgi:hypothetical protein